MARQPQRSLKHEYELYVEEEIENYKDSVPRSALLKIGDEAVANLRDGDQLALDELLLCDEVDRIITKRLRLPSYSTWRRRRLKAAEEMRRPERWGLTADAPIVRAAAPADPGRALVAGTSQSSEPLYLAANGHRVTAIDAEETLVAQVLAEADEAGIGERVDGCVGSLSDWTPDGRYALVVWNERALAGLSAAQRVRVIETLQSATIDGGVHLVDTIVAGRAAQREEILRRYAGWDVSLQSESTERVSFLARKAVA